LINNFSKYWLPLYIYAAVIFYISSRQTPLSGIDIPFLDNALHIGEYMIFGFLACRAFRSSPRKLFLENFKIFAILVSLLYGVSDEIHQLSVPTRQFSALDIFADGIGGMLGVFVYGKYCPL